MKRLFIPLCTDPFNWFESGEKEWELRKKSKQFNPDSIEIGSYVELRRGYVAKNGVSWGRVIDCKTFSSLKDVFASIPYQRIVRADNEEKAVDYVCTLLEIMPDTQVELVAIKIETITILGEISFADKYLPMLASGQKTTTVREGIRTYPPGFYNAFNNNKTKCVLIKVTKTEITKYGLLDDTRAATDGFDSASQLKEELLKYYPFLTDVSPMTTVFFEVA